MNEIKGTRIEVCEIFCEIADDELAVFGDVSWLHGTEIQSNDLCSGIFLCYFKYPATYWLVPDNPTTPKSL
jgi:hypothetical protein